MKREFRYSCAALLAAMLLFPGCSVKEDRSGVPVWLVIDGSKFNPQEYSGEVMFCSYEKGGARLTQKVSTDMGELCANIDEMTVAKGESYVAYVAGIEDMKLQQDSLLVIEYGGQCDSILIAQEHFETYEEEYHITAQALRNYTGITLKIVNDGSMDECPYTLHVKGDVCGINLKTLTPVKGTYLYVPQESRPFVFDFRIPRQNDDSIYIEIWGRDWGESREVYFGTFELGKYLTQLGYSWEAPDLKPLTITLDFARSAATITVDDWTEKFNITITI